MPLVLSEMLILLPKTLLLSDSEFENSLKHLKSINESPYDLTSVLLKLSDASEPDFFMSVPVLLTASPSPPVSDVLLLSCSILRILA